MYGFMIQENKDLQQIVKQQEKHFWDFNKFKLNTWYKIVFKEK